MSAVGLLKFATQRVTGSLSYRLSKARNQKYAFPLSFSDVIDRFPQPDDQWAYFHHFFWHLAPSWLREHRAFFASDRRGFGEDATHAMWFLLLRELRPLNFLEIGVYRGQVLSLAKLVAAREGFPCRVLGISPLEAIGDSVSKYGAYNYERDVRTYCDRFGVALQPNELLRSLSTGPQAGPAIRGRRWDVAYVDGGHDYPVVRRDFEMVGSSLTVAGVVVLDDAALHTGYHPKAFSFAGHPGPSQVMREAVEAGWRLVGQAGHNVVLKPPAPR